MCSKETNQGREHKCEKAVGLRCEEVCKQHQQGLGREHKGARPRAQ